MKIDTAIREFMEKYDREAMSSIDRLSTDRSLLSTKSKIKVFNIREGFGKFREYLEGYGSYKVKNLNNDDASPQDIIMESASNFISTQIIKEVEISYNELPTFVEAYFAGINDLNKTVDEVKSMMIDGDVLYEDVGDVNTFCDQFIDLLNESMDRSMNKILWASGYNAKKRLSKDNKRTKDPVFL